MEIGYSNISSNQQTVQGNGQSEQSVRAGKLQAQTGDISNLSAGKTFQGEILDIKGSKVSISLDNGQVLNAKMEGDINLSIGQKLLFEVKANTGAQIEIRPTHDSINPNPVLQKALQAANIPMTDRNMQMVNSMLNEGMSIDKQSLSNMLRQFSINSEADAATLVKMSKLGIAVTPENVEQFENYKNYEHRIVKDINNIANNLVKLLGETASEDKNLAVTLNNKLVDILNNSASSVDKAVNSSQEIHIPLEKNTSEQGVLLNKDSQIVDVKANEQAQIIKEAGNNEATQDFLNSNMKDVNKLDGLVLEHLNGKDIEGNKIDVNANINNGNIFNNESQQISDTTIITDKNEYMNNTELNNAEINNTNNFINKDNFQNSLDENTLIKSEAQTTKQSQFLETILSSEERANLSDKLKTLGADTALLEQVKEGKIENKELLNMVKTLLSNPGHAQNAEELFSSKEYNEILRQVIKQQWLVEPDHLKEPNKMENLYKQMDEQTKQLSEMLESAGKEATNVFKDVSNVRSNLNFMEQINQNFTYIQIPIQFTNEEAHSDLYVYTNKKNLKNHDGNLSVLLHLDMEVLGTTDIYIQMSGNSVSAKFSLESNEAITLVSDNLDSLIKKLEEKGYKASAKVGPIEKEQEFVDDFLEKDKVVTSLKRYAFDVRT